MSGKPARSYSGHHTAAVAVHVAVYGELSAALSNKALQAHPCYQQIDFVLHGEDAAALRALLEGVWNPSGHQDRLFRFDGDWMQLLVEPWVRAGQCVAVEVPQAQHDSTEACFAVTRGGRLCYSMSRAAFQTAGLPGTALKAPAAQRIGRPGGGQPQCYFGSIDMTKPSFAPGQPLFSKVQAYLQGRHVQLLVHSSTGQTIAHEHQVLSLSCDETVFKRCYCPVLDQKTSQQDDMPVQGTCKLLYDAFEWLGSVACGLQRVLRRYPQDPYLSALSLPAHLPYAKVPQVLRVRVQGLITPEVQHSCNRILRYIKQAEEPSP